MKLKRIYTLLLFFTHAPLLLAQSNPSSEWSNTFDVDKMEIYGKGGIFKDTPSHLLGEINDVLVYKTVKTLYGLKDGKIVYSYKTKIDAYKGERIEVFQNKLPIWCAPPCAYHLLTYANYTI